MPIELEGADQAPGVREEGGVLEHVTREVTVEALPTEIPERIDVDVSEMVIGDTMTLETVTPPTARSSWSTSPPRSRSPP